MSNKILPRGNNAANGYVVATTSTPTAKKPTEVRLSVSVNDRALHQIPELNGFDNLEKAFALVPTRNKKNEVVWERVDVPYAFPSADRGGNRYDIHEATIKSTTKGSVIVSDGQTKTVNIKVDDLRKLGVAYGLKTNAGDVWLQYQGDNALLR
jgi:hypothetical protein